MVCCDERAAGAAAEEQSRCERTFATETAASAEVESVEVLDDRASGTKRVCCAADPPEPFSGRKNGRRSTRTLQGTASQGHRSHQSPGRVNFDEGVDCVMKLVDPRRAGTNP